MYRVRVYVSSLAAAPVLAGWWQVHGTLEPRRPYSVFFFFLHTIPAASDHLKHQELYVANRTRPAARTSTTSSLRPPFFQLGSQPSPSAEGTVSSPEQDIGLFFFFLSIPAPRTVGDCEVMPTCPS